MSSPLCANCSRDASRVGLEKGRVMQVGTKTEVGTVVEVTGCGFEVVGPVVGGWVPEVTVPVVKVMVSAVELTGPAMEAVSLVVQAVTVHVLVDSLVEVKGSAYKLKGPMAHVGPWAKMGSADEVRGSEAESVVFAEAPVLSVTNVGTAVLAGLVAEVTVNVTQSMGPGVQVAGPAVDETDPVLE